MSESSTVSARPGSVAVIGGGVSGLAACYFLSQRGIRPILIEKANRLGGLIKTDYIDGCDLEAGPDSFIAAKTSVAALATELGIADRIIPSHDAARRIFVQHQGRLVPMPRGMSMMVPGDLTAALTSQLFTFRTKLRFISEQLCRPRTRENDVSVREFIADHFGDDILDSITEPLLSGVYGGDAGMLSATSVLPRFVNYERTYGSLIKGVRHERPTFTSKPETSLFLSFEGGMQTLIDALAANVEKTADVMCARAHTIQQASTEWSVLTSEKSIQVEKVVLACPAHVSAQLLCTAAPELSAHLGAIPYSSAILVTLVYDRTSLRHPLNGFGFLIPSSERKVIAAATWISTKFPSRTPPDRAAIRCFIVGHHADRVMNYTDSNLIETARQELERIMSIAATPLFTTVYRWPASMPQYTVGHRERIGQIFNELHRFKHLYVCGNGYDGVGIPDCIRLARQVVSAVCG